MTASDSLDLVAARALGREIFLDQLSQLVPEAVKELRDQTLTKYKRYCKGQPDGIDSWNQLQKTGAQDLKKAIEKWAGRYNLGCDWILDAAVNSLSMWANPPRRWPEIKDLDEGQDRDVNDEVPGKGPLQLSAGTYVWALRTPLSEEEERFMFECMGWGPTTPETWSEARVRIEDEFRAKLRKYHEHISAKLQSRQFTRITSRRKKQHYDWLVHYQVLGWKPIRIAQERCGCRESDLPEVRRKVAKAVKQTAELIGLPLRPSARGRPRNKRVPPS